MGTYYVCALLWPWWAMFWWQCQDRTAALQTAGQQGQRLTEQFPALQRRWKLLNVACSCVLLMSLPREEYDHLKYPSLRSFSLTMLKPPFSLISSWIIQFFDRTIYFSHPWPIPRPQLWQLPQLRPRPGPKSWLRIDRLGPGGGFGNETTDYTYSTHTRMINIFVYR